MPKYRVIYKDFNAAGLDERTERTVEAQRYGVSGDFMEFTSGSGVSGTYQVHFTVRKDRVIAVEELPNK